MAIEYVGGQTGQRAGSTTTQSNNYALTGGLGEATPAVGDMVVLAIAVGTDGRVPTNVPVGIGWTSLGELLRDQTWDATLNVSYKFMGSTPDTTFVTPASGNVSDAQRWTVHVYRGIDPVTPLDVTPVTNMSLNSTQANPGAITPVTDGAAIYCAGAGACLTAAAYTAPAGVVNFLGGIQSDTVDVVLGAGHQLNWTVATGTVNFAMFGGGTTGAGESWVAYTVAWRPAETGPRLVVYGRQLPLSPLQ